LLRKSSIFGQYFNLEDLTLFMHGMTIEELESTIASHDTYNYILKQKVEGDEVSHAYFWRHIQLMTVIYDSQSYGERSESHEIIAAHYEDALSEECQDFLLPTVAFHYMRTSRYDKQILYSEKLGLGYIKRAAFAEALHSLDNLIQVVKISHTEIDDIRMAYWLANLCMALIETKALTKRVKEHLMESLALVGRSWPPEGNPKLQKKTLTKTLLRLFKLWRKTKGGMQPVRTLWQVLTLQRKVSPHMTDEKYVMRKSTLLLCYRLMFRYGLYSATLSKDEAGLALFSVLCELIPNGYQEGQNRIEWTGFLFYASFGLSWSSAGLSKILFSK
ncbi:hypothetical protein HDV05_003027, partial [Chytridiales sp. JEL 0842]